MMLRPILIALAVAPVLSALGAQTPANLPRQHAPEPTTTDITVRDIMTRTYIIADDSMEGRDTGKRGGLRSATYIAGELKRLGVEPAGNSGTFFQAIPWIVRAPDSTATLSIGDTKLAWGTDFLLVPKIGFALALGGQPFGGALDATNVPTIYGGAIGDSSTVAPEMARGKI